MNKPLWQPSPQQVESANLTAFMHYVARHGGPACDNYAALYDWSVQQPAVFWQAVWDFCGVISSRIGKLVLVNPQLMPGARWFPDARLNYAENLLRCDGDETAIVFRGENQVKSQISFRELRHEVSRLAQALRAAGTDALAALNGGYQLAFFIGAVGAGAAALMALWLRPTSATAASPGH